jgi:transcription initiation factor TFIID subunit 12
MSDSDDLHRKRSKRTLVLDKDKIKLIANRIDPDQKVEADVNELLMDLLNEFITTTVSTSCKVAKLEKSLVLQPNHLVYNLERNYNIKVPGFGLEYPVLKQASKLALIKAAIKGARKTTKRKK